MDNQPLEFNTLEDVQAEIARQEAALQAVLSEEEEERNRIERREAAKKEAQRKLAALRKRESEGLFNEARERNKDLLAANQQAAKDLQKDVTAFAQVIHEGLQSLMTNQDVVRSYKAQQSHAKDALSRLFTARREAGIALKSNWTDADDIDINLSLGQYRQEFEQGYTLRAAILADTDDLPEETKRIYLAIANLLTGTG